MRIIQSIFFSFLLLLSLSLTSLLAQNSNEKLISGSYESEGMETVLSDLEKRYDLNFYYKKIWIEGRSITAELDNAPLTEALDTILKNQSLAYIFRHPNHIVLIADFGHTTITITEEDTNDFLAIGQLDLSKNEVTIGGRVYNGEIELPLAGAVITVRETSQRIVTPPDGSYSILLPPGNYNLNYHHPTMEDLDLNIGLNGDGTLNVNMYKDVLRLDEVLIQDEAIDQNISETLTGTETLKIDNIKKLPAFFGEADIVSSVVTLPGVNKVGEGTSGFNVRGGNVGQNLILQDNATLYNASHLLGFFSSFNADVVQKVNFYKGAIPAKFGGRISSILDVELKSGNMKTFSGQGGAGFINSRLSLEGPIEKDTTSFIVGLRGAYPNVIIRQLRDVNLSRSAAYFYDGSLKIDHLINENNRISGSFYVSRDNFKLANEAEYNYGNTAAGLEWNSTLTKDYFMDVKINLSSYDYTLTESENPQESSSLFSKINQAGTQIDLSREWRDHQADFGGSFIYYGLDPGRYRPEGSLSIIQPLNLDLENGIEAAVYLSDQYQIDTDWSIYGGLRFSYYNGGSSESITTSYGLEPRFALNYRTSENSSVKLGYNRMRQYIQFISNTTAATPIDLWKLSNQSIMPTIGDQVTLGYFKNLESNTIELSAELFYKYTTDLVEYKNNAELFLNTTIEEELLQGTGTAHGLEVMIKKNRGDLQGWLSYTYSRSFIEVAGESGNETINNGDKFPTNFDTPHNITAFSNIQVTRRFSVNANFQYNTGRPITYPESVYEYNGITIPNYSNRNSYRIPDFHRLDLSFTLTTSLRRKKTIEANWTLSIYNIYGRKNAYSVYFKNDPVTGEPQAYKLSVIGRPILALTYNFKF